MTRTTRARSTSTSSNILCPRSISNEKLEEIFKKMDVSNDLDYTEF